MAINDGSLAAPTGSPQIPNLLSGETVRPPWQVAGVDYAVGNPSNVALKDPATITMAGVSVDSAHHVITVTGSNVTLSGYDFSLNGGWGVSTQAANTSILDSKFVVGTNGNPPIQGTVAASNLYVGYTSIDGKGIDVGNTGLIQMKGVGLTVQYSAVMNSAGDLIQAHGSGIINLQNNLIEQGGIASGAHGDFLEAIGGPFVATILYNTTVQHSGGAGGTQGLMLEPDFQQWPGVITSGEYGNNTFVASGGNENYFLGITVADIVNTVTVHDNYFDATATFGFSPGGIRGGPDDGSNKTIFTNNVNMKNGAVVQDANASPVPPSAPATPAAPTITSFSTDSGVAGDHVTNDSTLTLTGTAAANSTVKVFDGSASLGTTTADSNGSWSYITGVLNDAIHVLKATDTVSGVTSAASSPLSVTVDTTAPAAPVLISDSVVNTNHVLLSGTAEANSHITVYDRSTAVGSITTGADGKWSVTTAALPSGAQALTAKAADAAGNTSVLSAALAPVIGDATAPAAVPKIVSFTTDSGVAGDGITNDNALTLTGQAVANSTVDIFDGSNQVGTGHADSTGAWTLTTSTLSEGAHNLTAIDTDTSGHTSAASAALGVIIDTHAPGAPTMAAYSPAGTAVGSNTTLDDLILKGAAEAKSTVDIFDGGKQIGVATADQSGAWSFDTGHLANGSHSFTSKAVDVAGNPGAASAVDAVTVNSASAVNSPAPAVDFTKMYENHWSHIATIKGTADAYSHVKLYDGATSMGTVTTAADGTWSFVTPSALSNTVHTFTAQEVDSIGHVVASSGSAILGSTRSDTLRSTAGDDYFVGNGHPDTFVFATNFGNDVIKDFVAGGRGHDVVQFSKSVYDSFASVLAHAAQVGQDVVISAGTNDSLTLKNTKLSALNSHDFHFA